MRDEESLGDGGGLGDGGLGEGGLGDRRDLGDGGGLDRLGGSLGGTGGGISRFAGRRGDLRSRGRPGRAGNGGVAEIEDS